MPGYKATVIGENFEFTVDEDQQLLDFSRTVFVDATDEAAARESALTVVREELLTQSLLADDGNQQIFLDDIQQVDILAGKEEPGDFIWHFPDDLYDDDD